MAAAAAIVATIALPLPAAAAAPPPPMPVISRNVPAFASGGEANLGNDGDGATYWRSGTGIVTDANPAWLALDLRSVSPASRSRVLVTWFDEFPNYAPGQPFNEYFHAGTTAGYLSGYNEPADYELQANDATGPTPPAAGWQTVVQVRGNRFHSRSHVIDLGGRTWIRFLCTSANSTLATEIMLQELEVRDASRGTDDAWLFLGDSITDGAMKHAPADNFSALVAASRGTGPVFEGGGMGNWTTANILHESPEGSTFAELWIAMFPGHYVAISFGTNDSATRVGPDDYLANERRLIDIILGRGKVPIVSTIPYSTDTFAGRLQNIPAYNQRLDQLFEEYGDRLIRGPDLYSYFKAHPEQLEDDIHPTAQGYSAIRRLWADVAITKVYAGVNAVGAVLPPLVIAGALIALVWRLRIRARSAERRRDGAVR